MLFKRILVTNCLHERKSTRSVFNKLSFLPSSHNTTRIYSVNGSFLRNRLGSTQNYVERKVGNMLSHGKDPRLRIRSSQLLAYDQSVAHLVSRESVIMLASNVEKGRTQ